MLGMDKTNLWKCQGELENYHVTHGVGFSRSAGIPRHGREQAGLLARNTPRQSALLQIDTVTTFCYKELRNDD
jgi:hypothetical protein